MKLGISLIFFLTCSQHIFCNVIRGRYTREITDYEVVLPRKVKPNGAFHSFTLPHFYSSHLRKKRSLDEDDKVHYQVGFNGARHHLELTPNVELTGLGLVVETWHSMTNLSSMDVHRPKRHLCHYLGKIRGQKNSRVAVSGCDGLVGHIVTENGTFFIEPVHGEEVQDNGEHLHVVYKRSLKEGEVKGPQCGTHDGKWLEHWARDLFTAKMEAIENGLGLKSLAKRQSQENVPRYVACGVISDKLFVDFHQDINKEEYVLTIMNVVNGYYSDDSIGSNIKIVVTKMVFLDVEKTQTELKVVAQVSKTLDNFCQWQGVFNHKDWNHPNHYDIAVLITRLDLCTDDMSCGLLGLAYMNRACNGINKNCCVNEDSGLILGIVITHEMGHLLGASHDSPDESGCSGAAVEPGAQTVMNPFVAAYTTNWSNCSKELIGITFTSELGDCLLDEPKDQPYPLKEVMVGTVYGHDYQCQQSFGKNSTSCKTTGVDQCIKLWCQKEGSHKCLSFGRMPMDGTICAPDKWCYKRECVEIGQTPEAVHGEWGDWGPWSACSRTCGAGVELRERLCDRPRPAHRGTYCLGKSKQFGLCNTQACDDKSPTFRAQQCSEFDATPRNGALHKWKPHGPPAIDNAPCKLYCSNEKNENILLKARVTDGTRCRLGTRDTCIQGKCEQVGCDWKVNSKAVEDVCGVCNGDGVHCKSYSMTFTKVMPAGQNSMVCMIPKNASNVVVRELDVAKNYLMAGSKTMEVMYLPMKLHRDPGEYMFGEDKAIYVYPLKYKEELFVKGPTKAAITIFYGFMEEMNPGVLCSYVTEDRTPKTIPVYEWAFLTWNQCSARCGTGSEISNPSCVEKTGGKVSDKFCNIADKPEPQSRSCNLQPCGTHWKVWKWGPCSGCLYKTGERKREVECVMESPTVGSDDDIIVSASKCCGSPPKKTELCNSSKPCEEKTKKKRKANRLDEEFLKYNMNTSDLEKYKNRFFKRASDNRPIRDDSNDVLFVDIVPESNNTLLIAKLSECKGDPMKLTEEDYESEGSNVPVDIPVSIEELHGKEAKEAINEILHSTPRLSTTVKPAKV